jgi:hypothetical protein
MNCAFTNNSAVNGGGAYGGTTLNYSTLAANTATSAGGGIFSTGSNLKGCIIYYNSAPSGANYSGNGSFSYSCITPLTQNSNITNDPVFVNLAAGNFRFQTNSPCIDFFANPPGGTDLDGRPRVVNLKQDIGAYEFQGAGIGEFIGWLQQYGLPTDGSADYADTDGDGLNNWQEWIAGTNPTNVFSVLQLLSPSFTNNPPGVLLTWQSVTNVNYFLQRSSDIEAQPAFITIESNLVGQAVTTSYLDTNAAGPGPFFYRIRVQ